MKIKLNAATRLASVNKVVASPLKATVDKLSKQMKEHGIRAEFHTIGHDELMMVILGPKAQFDKAKHIMDLSGNFKHIKDDLSESKYDWWAAEYSLRDTKDIMDKLSKYMRSHHIDAEFNMSGHDELMMIVTGPKAHFENAKRIMNLDKNFKHLGDDLSESEHSVWVAEYSM
jgi:hypothetical protein